MRAMTTIEDGENEGTLYELKSSAWNSIRMGNFV
jgi:hypothetical protein